MGTTNSKVREAFEEHRIIRRVDADPPEGDLEGGEVWFRTDTNEFRAYNGNSYGTLGFTADA